MYLMNTIVRDIRPDVRAILPHTGLESLVIKRYAQLDFHSCGLAAVVMLLKMFGVSYSIPDIVRSLKLTGDGVLVSDFFKTIGRFGLSSGKIRRDIRAVRKSIREGFPVVRFTKTHVDIIYGHSVGRLHVANCKWHSLSFKTTKILKDSEELHQVWGGEGMSITTIET